MKKLRIRDGGTIRKKVYLHVREQILGGEIPPHERLVEAKIAEDIGTSRTPVREALHNLELEGLIESIPRVGYVVKPIKEEEINEICEIRAVVEVLAARWAMQKARKKLIDHLAGNVARSETLIAKGDVKAFVDVDSQFHDVISLCSGSSRLRELNQVLRRHMLRYRIESIYTPENVLRAINGHKGILAALEAGDMEALERAIKGHLEQSRKDILRFAFREDKG